MIANIASDDALILPHRANPTGLNFRERQDQIVFVQDRADPSDPVPAESVSHALQAAARSFGLELHVLNATSERDLDAVFAPIARGRARDRQAILSSIAKANGSPPWPSITPCRRSISIASSPQPAA